MLVLGVGRRAPHVVLVEQRGAGGEHLAQGGLDGVDVGQRQGLPQPAADVVLGRGGVDPLQRRVDQQIAQIRVQQSEADRGLADQPLAQRQIGLHALEQGVVGGDAQGVDVTEVVQQPHVAELRQPGAAVLVPHGEGAGPVPAGLQHLREQLNHGRQLVGADEQPRRVRAERLLGGVAEELLRLWGPEHHAPAGVDDHRRHAQHIEQAGRTGRLRVVPASVGLEGSSCHPGSSSTGRKGRHLHAPSARTGLPSDGDGRHRRPSARAHGAHKQEHGRVEDGTHGRCVRTHGCCGRTTGGAHAHRTERALRRVHRRGGGGVRARCRPRLDAGRGGTPRPSGVGDRRHPRRGPAGDAGRSGPGGRDRRSLPGRRGVERTHFRTAPGRPSDRCRPAGLRVLPDRRGRVLSDLGAGTAAAVDGGPVRPRRLSDPLTGRHGRDGHPAALRLAQRHPGTPRRRPPRAAPRPSAQRTAARASGGNDRGPDAQGPGDRPPGHRLRVPRLELGRPAPPARLLHVLLPPRRRRQLDHRGLLHGPGRHRTVGRPPAVGAGQ